MKRTRTSLLLLLGAGVSQAVVVSTGVSSTDFNDAAIMGTVKTADIGANATVTGPSGFFTSTPAVLNDGIVRSVATSTAMYLSNGFQGENNFPGVFVLALDVATNSGGYDIMSLDSFAGWQANGPQLGNQKFTLGFSNVSSPAVFTDIGTFEYLPFNNNTATGGSVTKLTIADDAGARLATGVHSVRVQYLDHGFSGPDVAVNGSVYYEMDINGSASMIPEPASTTLLGLGGLALLLRRRK